MKLIDFSKHPRWLEKESSVLSKRIVDSKQKNRRCSAKESTMLRGSSQYTLRYHLTAMHREVVIREKHSRIIVFPLGFLWSFLSVAFLSLGIHPEQHNEAEGKLGKDTCFSDEIQCLCEDSCESLNHSWHRNGSACHIPQLPQCMDRVIQYNPQSISTEPDNAHAERTVV